MPHIYEMMEGTNPHFTVADVIYDCGVTYGALFNDDKKSDRMAAELFDDYFSSYMDKTYEEFNEDLDSNSNLTVVNGKIRLVFGKNNNIKAFIQWTME